MATKPITPKNDAPQICEANWKSGDLALCIKGGSYAVTGRVYTVVATRYPDSRGWKEGGHDVGLILDGASQMANCWDGGMFWSGAFVKVTPTKTDNFDRQVIGRLREREEA